MVAGALSTTDSATCADVTDAGRYPLDRGIEALLPVIPSRTVGQRSTSFSSSVCDAHHSSHNRHLSTSSDSECRCTNLLM